MAKHARSRMPPNPLNGSNIVEKMIPIGPALSQETAFPVTVTHGTANLHAGSATMIVTGIVTSPWPQRALRVLQRIAWFLDLQQKLAGWSISLAWWITAASALVVYWDHVAAAIRRFFFGDD
jgi:hypothetical protein